MWDNGYEKEELPTELRSCRIKTDAYEKNSHNFNLISLFSYLSFGLLAPILLYSKEKSVKNDSKSDESNKNEKEPFVKVSNSNEEKTNEEINLRSYSYKYRNFIFSPRTRFVYESVRT